MNSMRFAARRAPLGALVSLAILAGCAATSPAPVVNRTPQSALPPVQTLPPTLPPGPATAGQPGAADPAGLPGQPGQARAPGEAADGGVQTTPIRTGSVEPGSGGAAAGATVSPADPNLRTGPRAVKRPYDESALRSPPAIERPPAPVAAVTIPAQTPPIPTTAAPSAAQARPPSGTPATAPASVSPTPAPVTGGSGVFDGVAFAWPAGGQVFETFAQTNSKGLSINGRAGDSVVAAADGRVIFSGAGPRGYGNLVIVKHAGELLTVYAHNRSLAVKEGDTVKRGQKIAELGNSGTDKPKLHFEIRQAGKPIDPIAVLPRR